jgi:hypothetical protein
LIVRASHSIESEEEKEMKIISNHRQPLTLEGGVILAAAGTDGSAREVEKLTERDRRRYLDRGLIAVVTEPAVTPAQSDAATDAQAGEKRRVK